MNFDTHTTPYSMKTSNLFASLLCLALLSALTSCSPAPTTTPTEATPEQIAAGIASAHADMLAIAMAKTVKDTISLCTFNQWVVNWDQNGRAWMDTAKLTAFTMPLVDLSQVLAEKGAATSRFYLGLETEGKGFDAKLMVVGVDSSNYDMINYAKGQYVYDLSQACPPYCGKK